ncbi:hypothetical protein ADK60_15840 [Streptomyces sp. XY431]|nr:hypothetical protein ADK60_15840 [Streptomyces sp. XY431]
MLRLGATTITSSGKAGQALTRAVEPTAFWHCWMTAVRSVREDALRTNTRHSSVSRTPGAMPAAVRCASVVWPVITSANAMPRTSSTATDTTVTSTVTQSACHQKGEVSTAQ